MNATSSVPEAEEHIAVDPNNSSNLVAMISDFSLRGGFNTSKFSVSTDNGATWGENFVPLDANGLPVTSDGISWIANSDPVVAIDRLGNVYLENLYINVSPSFFDGLYVSVGTLGPSGLTINATNAVATNGPTSSNEEDKEWIAADNSGTTDNVYVCWTRFTPTSDFVLFSTSTDHGNSWSSPMQVSDPALDGAVQGCQASVGQNGEVYVAYEGFFVDNAGNPIQQHYVTESTDNGGSFGTPVAVTPFFNEISFVASYRFNSFPALAVNPNNGRVVDVYSGNDSRGGPNVHFVQCSGDLSECSKPVVINDVFAGAQFFPAVAIDASGTINVSWFDTRNSGAAGAALFDIFATFSSDGGQTFAPNARVTPTQIVAGTLPTFIGDYSGIAAAGGSAHPVWTSGGFNNGVLQTSTLTLP